ncbi:hypothetical protein [Malaciobacter mytili]|uniref:DUF350 domain-containing protein n=1 Tax=Malaciobacter mytili TaxID=603050 RepID=UPI003A859489
MDKFLLMDFLIKLFYALVTLGFIWMTARLSDKMIGLDFKTEFEKVRHDSKALGIYFAGRLIAIAIIVSSFF